MHAKRNWFGSFALRSPGSVLRSGLLPPYHPRGEARPSPTIRKPIPSLLYWRKCCTDRQIIDSRQPQPTCPPPSSYSRRSPQKHKTPVRAASLCMTTREYRRFRCGMRLIGIYLASVKPGRSPAASAASMAPHAASKNNNVE